MPNPTAKPLLVIVGPTASGKTALAIEIAKRFSGEIVCADSRTVYKEFSIGTAKPLLDEQKGIPHHLLDIVSPEASFTVADFKRLADDAINDIRSHGKLPILVGGSGLYVDAVIYDYSFSESAGPRNPQNTRHLDMPGAPDRDQMIPGVRIVGLQVDRELLKTRVSKRVNTMVDAGFIDEVRQLREKYSDSKIMNEPGYAAFSRYLDSEITLEDAKGLFIKNDMQLARRQMSWFRRNKSIQWLDNPNSYVDIITTLLNK